MRTTPRRQRCCIARGANINAQSRQIDYPEMRLNLSFMATTELPRGGMSPVMLAAREGALDSARVLADAKANLDLQDPEGTTALMLAIMNVHYDVALMLIEKGANPNIYDKAAMGALYAVVDMRTQRPLTNMPPRKPSSDVDSLDVVKALLKHGADVNAVLKTTLLRRHHSTGDGSLGEGTTPLMRAARFGDAAAMRVLIEAGADVSKQQRNGNTALLFASGVGFQIGDGGFARTDTGKEEDAIAAIKLFLDAGADVNQSTTCRRDAAACRGGARRRADRPLPRVARREPRRQRQGRTHGTGRRARQTCRRRRARPRWWRWRRRGARSWSGAREIGGSAERTDGGGKRKSAVSRQKWNSGKSKLKVQPGCRGGVEMNRHRYAFVAALVLQRGHAGCTAGWTRRGAGAAGQLAGRDRRSPHQLPHLRAAGAGGPAQRERHSRHRPELGADQGRQRRLGADASGRWTPAPIATTSPLTAWRRSIRATR